MDKKALIKTAVASVVTAGLTLAAHSAVAAQNKMEKCYGIAKAGKSDCGGAASGHACQGQSKVDRDPNEWILVPKGTCDKIAGGSLTHAQKAPTNPQKNS